MLNKLKRQSYALGFSATHAKDAVFEAQKDKAKRLPQLVDSLKADIHQFLKIVSSCVHVNRTFAACLLILPKNLQNPAEQDEAIEFIENVTFVDSVFGSNFEGILSQSMDSSAIMKLQEFRTSVQGVLDRIPDREKKLQDMTYYRDKVEQLEKKASELPADQAPDAEKLQRNRIKLEDAEQSYFATNEVLKVQMSVLNLDAVDVARSVLSDFLHTQRLFFGFLGTSLELIEQDNENMRDAFKADAAPHTTPTANKRQVRAKKAGFMNRFKRNVLGMGQGAAFKTIDPDYDKLVSAFEDYKKATIGTHTACTNFKQAAVNLQEKCSAVTRLVFGPFGGGGGETAQLEGDVNQALVKWLDQCQGLNGRLQRLEEHVHKLQEEQAELDELMHEREEARSLFDYYRKQLDDLAGKASELKKVQPKLDQAKNDFDPINEETKQALRSALQHKLRHMVYLLGGFLHSQKMYLSGIADVWAIELPGYTLAEAAQGDFAGPSAIVYSKPVLPLPDTPADELSASASFREHRSASAASTGMASPKDSSREERTRQEAQEAQARLQEKDAEADEELELARAQQREKAALKAKLKAELAAEDEQLAALLRQKKVELQREKLKEEMEEEEKEIREMEERKARLESLRRQASVKTSPTKSPTTPTRPAATSSGTVAAAGATTATKIAVTAPPSSPQPLHDKPPRPARKSVDAAAAPTASPKAPEAAAVSKQPSSSSASTSSTSSNSSNLLALPGASSSTSSLGAPRPRSHTRLQDLRDRYTQSTKAVEEKAQLNVAAMKAKRGEDIIGLSSEEKRRSTQVLAGMMSAKAERDNQVEDSIKAITAGVLTKQDGSTETLTHVNLNNTGVFRTCGKEALAGQYKELCGALAKNNQVTCFEITNAEVDDDFCQELSLALRDHPSLTEVNLNSNPIGSRGVRALCEALRHNGKLTTLKLDNLARDVNPDTEKELLSALEQNSTLTKLIFNFKQRHDNETKEKYLNRNVAAVRKARLAQQTHSESPLAQTSPLSPSKRETGGGGGLCQHSQVPAVCLLCNKLSSGSNTSAVRTKPTPHSSAAPSSPETHHTKTETAPHSPTTPSKLALPPASSATADKPEAPTRPAPAVLASSTISLPSHAPPSVPSAAAAADKPEAPHRPVPAVSASSYTPVSLPAQSTPDLSAPSSPSSAADSSSSPAASVPAASSSTSAASSEAAAAAPALYAKPARPNRPKPALQISSAAAPSALQPSPSPLSASAPSPQASPQSATDPSPRPAPLALPSRQRPAISMSSSTPTSLNATLPAGTSSPSPAPASMTSTASPTESNPKASPSGQRLRTSSSSPTNHALSSPFPSPSPSAVAPAAAESTPKSSSMPEQRRPSLPTAGSKTFTGLKVAVVSPTASTPTRAAAAAPSASSSPQSAASLNTKHLAQPEGAGSAGPSSQLERPATRKKTRLSMAPGNLSALNSALAMGPRPTPRAVAKITEADGEGGGEAAEGPAPELVHLSKSRPKAAGSKRKKTAAAFKPA
eukprot:g83357.t1